MSGPRLGIAQLANEPIRHLGFLGNPGTFAFPVCYATAADAWAERVLDADPALIPAYVASVRELEAQGVSAIVANCGFAVTYQDAITRDAAVPVATSSLMLVPLALRMISPDRTVGVITADSSKLRPAHLRSAGVGERDLARLAVEGLDGTASLAEMLRPVPELDIAQLEADVLAAVARLAAARANLGALVFECTALGAVSDRVRAETGLPLFDVLVLARLVMDACGHVPRGRQPRPPAPSARRRSTTRCRPPAGAGRRGRGDAPGPRR